MAARVEQARGFNTALILAPQVTAGMGDPIEAERITGSAETVICHRVNTPEQIISLAGTKRAIEHSTHYAPGGPKLPEPESTTAETAQTQHPSMTLASQPCALQRGPMVLLPDCGSRSYLRAEAITDRLPLRVESKHSVGRWLGCCSSSQAGA
jgi:hypothetical protein